ncbi:sodium-coupled monocarboxylate transporter 2-like [Haliotis rufescens]|uniref:sodium-coupled monocarboxylate transporter 2-like n=1 Tax=Haliotis rufescens TaxID=6454 RepID=UPI00201F10A7|nr:sodium-coupled monocarboxylate transporter 2-like [Haliotis rufescens]
MAGPPTLSIVDYIVIAATLAVPLGMGVYFAIKGRKRNTKEEYLLGGRNLHVIPVTLSLFVTFMSSTSLIGMPAETFTTGFVFVLHVIAVALSYLIGIVTIVPIMHTLQVTSMYEYFHLRFQSPLLRLLVTVIGMFQKIVFTAVVLLSPAVSIQTATGLPFWVSVVIVGLVGTTYTSIGGIRGVVLVDVFQAAIIMFGIFIVLVKGVHEVGGLATTWELAKEGGRIPPVNFDPDPRVRHSFWSLIVGGLFTFFAFTFDQSAIQRICAIPKMSGAQIVYAVNIFVVSFYIICVCFMGIVAYSYFATIGCDPFEAGHLTNRNQLMPYFVMKIFEDFPGMSGIYLATIFSGALSTISSITNGLAANTIEDVLRRPFEKCGTSESVKLLTAKLAVWFYGGICIGMAFLLKELPGTIIQTAIALLGACGGPIVGTFFLGALFPWTNKIGAIAGVLVSLAMNLWLTVGATLYGHPPVPLPPAPGNSCDILTSNSSYTTTPPTITSTLSLSDVTTIDPKGTVYDISYQDYGLIGCVIAVVVGLIVSLATCRMYPRIEDERFLFPFVRPLWRSNSHDKSEKTEETENGNVLQKQKEDDVVITAL